MQFPSIAFLFFPSLLFAREPGGRGSVGILAPCALCSTGPWRRSISPLYPLSLLCLPPLLLPTKHPSPPPQPLQLPLVVSLTAAPASNYVLFKSPHPHSLLLLSPSLTLPRVSPIIHCSLHFPSSFSILLPSQSVAAGPASVTQMHPVALGA